jgi:hypothetical protein
MKLTISCPCCNTELEVEVTHKKEKVNLSELNEHLDILDIELAEGGE